MNLGEYTGIGLPLFLYEWWRAIKFICQFYVTENTIEAKIQLMQVKSANKKCFQKYIEELNEN